MNRNARAFWSGFFSAFGSRAYIAAFLATLLACALLLAACGATDPRASWTLACETYASTLITLSDARDAGRLSASDIDRINRIEPRATALCDRPSPPEGADFLSELDRYIVELTAISSNLEE